MKNKGLKKCFVYLGVILFTFHFSLSTSSCSEDETSTEEYADWQARNDAATAQWAANGSYRKIRTYTQDEELSASASDYIYVEVLESGSGTESPLATDTVRVAYRGRLIPSASYADGYVFDQSYLGDFSWQTIGVASNTTAGGFMQGFATAVQNMHIGDRWLVHIPYTLMYNASSSTSYPAYSNMIFDVALVDFWHPGETRPAFRARQR